MTENLNPRFLIAVRNQASHLAQRKFPSSCLNFSQKNIELYREMKTLLIGMYYV
jgi:hypothetical protein